MAISWILAIILVIILGISIAFALRVFYNSSGEMRKDGDVAETNLFSMMSKKDKKEIAREMKLKITELEENVENYSNQFKRLNHRIELLEREPGKTHKKEEETDWENAYRQEKIDRENIELELADTTDALRHAEEKLITSDENSQTLSTLESKLERQFNESHILQNKIEELQRRMVGAENREQELMEELEHAKKVEQEFKALQKNYNSLISENDDLHQRLATLSKNETLLAQTKQKLTEVESMLDAHDFEKTQIKNTVDNILAENTSLSNKLKDLLEKFTEEKYAG
jgi:DNA repair exonuclease SbcCD ATPase subunit